MKLNLQRPDFDMRDRVVAYRGMRLLNRVSTYPRIRCDMETYRIDPRSEGDEIANGEEGMSPEEGGEPLRNESVPTESLCLTSGSSSHVRDDNRNVMASVLVH
jgi:hypothetical protein